MATTRILVLDRGHVLIARVIPHPRRAFWYRVCGRIIRQWGTTTGLAQLKDGPKTGTRTEELAIEDIPWRAIIRELHVDAVAWKQHLSAPQRKRKEGKKSTPTG